MRGDDDEQGSMFRYRSSEGGIPRDPPLRPMRARMERALREVGPRFAELHARTACPWSPPGRLLRQIPFSVRSERQLMEPLEPNLRYRWLAGLSMGGAVWVFTCTAAAHDLVRRRNPAGTGMRALAGRAQPPGWGRGRGARSGGRTVGLATATAPLAADFEYDAASSPARRAPNARSSASS